MTLKSKKLVKFKNVSHGFFGKKGGVSNGIYSALNCGPGSKDKISNDKKNKESLSMALRDFKQGYLKEKNTNHAIDCLANFITSSLSLIHI